MKNLVNWTKTFFIGVLVVGCSSREKKTEEPAKLTLPVVQLSRQSTTLQRDYVTTLEAVRNVEIRARVSGFLEKIYVDEGQTVRQGQLLFSLNAAEYKVGLDKARASLRSALAGAKTAEVEVGRVKLLVDKKIVSPPNWNWQRLNSMPPVPRLKRPNPLNPQLHSDWPMQAFGHLSMGLSTAFPSK
ncbi:efflux RND transporter periplasmic adaptor subunit [Spirosoma telluris]|uniref:efflux RND transporter periplasmic adaptor subunit n=1 Tax=Spirosoma telluris TaxID=2183553 RepID=UPI002FC37222